MAIADELRAWAHGPDEGDDWLDRIDEFCDRIDAEHEADVSTACRLAAALDDDALAERGYIALPVDADGVPIRVGDVMEVKFDTKRRPFTVSFVGERAVAFWVVGQPDLKSFNLDTVLVTHHHEPTVEDVLREFANAVLDCDNTEESVQRVIDDYAKRLRPAGDGE